MKLNIKTEAALNPDHSSWEKFVNDKKLICLELFGKYKYFSDMKNACREASWAMNREIYPIEIYNMIKSSKPLIRYR